MKIVTRFPDGTVEDYDGNILSFGLDRFVSDICNGSHCFMCGASQNDTEFNDEHIIPKWVLRKLDLYKEKSRYQITRKYLTNVMSFLVVKAVTLFLARLLKLKLNVHLIMGMSR